MDAFTYNVFIPSLNDYVRFKELTNSQYITILKFIQNADDPGLQTYINYLIHVLITDDTYIPTLNRVDIFCILLTVRMICVGNIIELQVKAEDKVHTNKIDVSSIIEKVANNSTDIDQYDIEIAPGVIANIGLPIDLYYEDYNLFITDCIKTISYKSDTQVNFNELHLDQKKDILDRTDSSLFNNILKLLNNINKTTEPITIIDSSDRINNTDPLIINIFDNSLFEVLKFLYRDDLVNVYDKQYILYSKIHLPSYDYRSLTPAEVEVYLNSYARELKQRKEDATSSRQPNIGQPFG